MRGPADGDGPRQTGKEPLLELFSIRPQEISVPGLFGVVDAFGKEKSKQRNLLAQAERSIEAIYQNFSPAGRASFFAMLYDRFSESYDQHMHETGHFRAIRRCMQYAMPYLRTPILDLTAGTGEPLMYALEFMESSRGLRGSALDLLVPKTKLIETDLSHLAIANEISTMMLAKARLKHSDGQVGFTSFNACELPDAYRRRFNTVISAQTFHLISDEDKTKLVRSMREALAPGGVAVVLEEDPFRITQSIYIESLSLFLRAVVNPIKYQEKLWVYFTNDGFIRLDDSATAPIDSEHAMRVHIFQQVAQA